MKEAAFKPALSSSTRKTRTGVKTQNSKKPHQRGDKVVVNGAKQSLLAILKKYICKCSQHSLEKLTMKFVRQNKITASYDILVWMFIFIRKNCSQKIFNTILNEYLVKMKKKKDQDENHQSQVYKAKKKQTIAKFIQSGHILSTECIDLKILQASIEALYSKGMSKEKSFQKIKKFLLEKTNFDHCLQFQDGPCSFIDNKDLIQIQNPQNLDTISNNFQYFSQIGEEQIYVDQIQHVQSNEEDNKIWMEPLANMSPRRNAPQQSLDLFDELIHHEESVHSIFNPYLN